MSLLLVLLLLGVEDGIGDYLRKWRDDNPEVRERATREILKRWKTWTDADLEELKAAARQSDAEIVSRAKEALRRIANRRALGPALEAKVDAVEALIANLRFPDGKAQEEGFVNPGGPMFGSSPPMKKLVDLGPAIEPLLLDELQDPEIQSEIAIVLSTIGGTRSLPALIEQLPTREKLSPDEARRCLCLLYSLWRMTGMAIGIHHKWMPEWTPKFRTEWKSWHERNKNALYAARTSPRLRVDTEAKLAGKSSEEFRKDHPWIAFGEIREWKATAAHEHRLFEFCLSTILDLLESPHRPRDAVRTLAHLRDPRALQALHYLCAGDEPGYDIFWSLFHKADPTSLPVLERFASPSEADRVVKRIRLVQKYRKQVEGKGLRIEQQTSLMECLDGEAGVAALIKSIRNSDHDWIASHDFQVAGLVDRESMRSCLKEIARDEKRTERVRTLAHGALARLGDQDSMAVLKSSLSGKTVGVRVAAAEGLWNLGSREGAPSLREVLELRPLETGSEGVSSTGGGLKVEALKESKVEYVRRACELLGEMEDRAAVPALKRLLSQNLNGILGVEGGSGSGWSGRPDAVALARLGDDSGIDLLRESIRKGDRLGVVGSWGNPGDFVAIGQKRFIPEIAPLLGHDDDDKRVLAARAILLLIEQGR